MSRLSSILDSHQGCAGAAGPELISDGTPENKHFISKLESIVTDFSRKCDQRTSFNEYEANLASVAVNAGERSLRDLTRDGMYVEKNKNKRIVVKGLKWVLTNSDHLMGTQKEARKKSQKAYQSSFPSSLNNSGNFIRRQPSASTEISLSKLTSATLGTVCNLSHREKVRLPEGYSRSIRLEKHVQVDEKNMQQAQKSSKSFLDPMFADRKLICREGTRIESSKPFSEILEVLNTDRDLFMELWSEPDCQLEKCIKSFHSYQIKKETNKLVRDSKIAKCESQDTIVTMQAEPVNRNYSLKFACHCSSSHSHERSSSRVLNGKLISFSVREIKKKWKHTFGGTRKESNQFPTKLSHNISIFGDDCIHGGVDATNPLSYFTSANTKEKLGKKQGLKLERRPNIAWETDTVREKIDISSVRFSKKHGVHVVLEENRKNLNAAGTTSEKSPKTLQRIISSLEHGQMRFSSYNSSHIPNGKECDHTREFLSVETSSSLIPSTDDEAQDTISSAKSNDELKIIETNDVLHSEAPNYINSTTERTAKIELHEEDGTVMHSISDALSDNETFTKTVDDFPSTPTSIHQLDMPENSKYQEEHESPVSVLDQFFAQDVNSPSNINVFQTDAVPLKPRCLDFDDCSFESSPEDYISRYVHLVLQAAALNCDPLPKIWPLSEKLLQSFLFDEIEFLLSESWIDTKLLLDHMNEILFEIRRSHILSHPWSATVKPRIRSVQLEELVIHEIMREADFYLLPRTEKRTLDQLVAKDMSRSRLWLDLRPETEHIMVHIAEDIMLDSILDVMIEFYS